MKKWILGGILVLCLVVVTGCGCNKTISKAQKQKFLNYMETKYQQQFVIKKIAYKKEAGGAPVIPKPKFMRSSSDNIRAEMVVDGADDSQATIIVDYDATTGTFSDQYHAQEITEALYYYGLTPLLNGIEEIVKYEWDIERLRIQYPEDKDGFYDLKAYQPTYALDYLKKHEVSIGGGSTIAVVSCDKTTTADVIEKFDQIFLEVFRSKRTNVEIEFYTEDQRNFLEDYFTTSRERPFPYMTVKYQDGKRQIEQ